MRGYSVIALFSAFILLGCGKQTSDKNVLVNHDQVIWSVATFEVYPNQGEDYLKFLKDNWVVARDSALQVGFVVDWEVWIEEPVPTDSADTWNLVMLTAYKDSSAYANREALFTPILEAFGKPEPINGKGPRQMARFLEEHPMKKAID